MIEIDGVRSAFESPVTQAGDFISDEYQLAIELATSPGTLDARDAMRLASAIRRLNRHHDTIACELEIAGLTDIYNSVASQLNVINGAVGRTATLQLVNSEATERRSYSSSIVWAEHLEPKQTPPPPPGPPPADLGHHETHGGLGFLNH